MKDRLARLVELVGAALLAVASLCGGERDDRLELSPPFTVGLRISNPDFSSSCYLSRGDKQKQQRMRGDLCPVEELRFGWRAALIAGQKAPRLFD